MIPPPSSPSSSEEYSSHRIPWTLIIQVGGLALAIVVIFLLSSHYPVLNWIGDARKQIESLGLWSGIVYPIAYAVCNVLLLPGNSEYRRWVPVRTVVGIPHRSGGQLAGCSGRFLYRPLVGPATDRKTDPQ